MAEPHEFFMEKALTEIVERIRETMEKRDVTLVELASRAEVSPEDLREMFRTGEGLTVMMAGRLFYHLSYKWLVATAPLCDRDRTQAVGWSES